MALKLDNTLLEELGLASLPENEKQLLLRQIYEKLEMNVGMRLANQMSNEQLDEFEKFVDSNDDKGAFQWLEGNFPDYKSVVNDEFEKLKAEIQQFAPQMLAVAAQNAQQPVQPPMQPAEPTYAQPSPQYQQQYQQPQPAPVQPYPGQQAQQPYPGQQPQQQPGQYQQPDPYQQYQQPQQGQYPPSQPPAGPAAGQQYPPTQ